MLRRSDRLSAGQLEAVMKEGRVAHSPLFILRVLPTSGHPRISAVVPKKTVRTAVGRNKLRRRMYAGLREVYPSIKGGLDAAVFAKSPAITASMPEISQGLRSLFVKAGVLK